jgi:hypothetical protein
MVIVALVAPEMLALLVIGIKPWYHWYVRLVPVADTVNEIAVPSHTVCDKGCVVIIGAALKVKATLFEIAGVGHAPETTTL